MSIYSKSRFLSSVTALVLSVQVGFPETGHSYISGHGRACLAPYAMANTELDILADRLDRIGAEIDQITQNLPPSAGKGKKVETDFSRCVQTAESFVDFLDILPNVKQGRDILYSYEKKLQAVLANVSLDLALDKRAGLISQEEYDRKMAQLKNDIAPLLQKLDEFILSGAKTAKRIESGKIVIDALEEQYRRYEITMINAASNFQRLRLTGESRKRTSETKEHQRNAIQGMNMARLYNLLILNANERMKKLNPEFSDERTQVLTRFRQLMAQMNEQKTADMAMVQELISLTLKLRPWRLFSEKEQSEWSQSRLTFLSIADTLRNIMKSQETPDTTAQINKLISQLLTLDPSAEPSNTELIQTAA